MVASTSSRRRLFKLSALALSGLLTLAVLEVGLRVYYAVHNAREPRRMVTGGPRGWITTPDLRMSYVLDGYGRVDYSTGVDGFRRFGEVDTERTKVLVLGDSFTHATQVSDGSAYFDVLQDSHPDLEVFAYGVGGYGTLQELMALEEYRERIGPDLILWQFCVNDFIANEHALELASRSNNNHMRRPYLEGGRIIYRHPDGLGGVLAEWSYVVRRLNVLIDSVLKRTAGTVETRLSLEYPPFRRSLETTRELLRRAVETADGVPIVAFNVVPPGTGDYAMAAFEQLCRIEGLSCVPDLRPALAAAQRAGVRIDGGPGDAHWNQAGHAIAGTEILRFLEAQGFVRPTR